MIIAALISAGVVLILVTWVKESYETASAPAIMLLTTGILITGIGIIIWIRRGIKAFYKRRMKERGVELIEQELAEKKEEIRRLTEQNDVLRVANHKINHRLAALEHSIAGLASRIQNGNASVEMSGELSAALEGIQCLSQDYQSEVSRIKGSKPLPSAKIKLLDDLFEYFSAQCMDSGIDFNLKVTGSIPYMVENIIPQSKLETMIGDHLKDALIAINAGDNPFRSILVVLGLVEDCYALTIYDSGISFEVDTLVRLGTERVTTHAGSGGSGIGFMTTFETMRECGASLVIHEKKPRCSDFTKSVTVRFDGKNQYVIETCRPDEFPEQNGRTELIIIKSDGE